VGSAGAAAGSASTDGELPTVIEELHIRGLGVIEEAQLALAPGLTVVTGETGAGKTMVVTALELLLGARADSGLVRAGATAALVEAVVDPPPEEAAAWQDGDGGALLVTRELPAEGRSRARIAGRLAPVSALADVLGSHVEVHGQHVHVRLSRPEVQRGLLDRYAGEEHHTILEGYRQAHRSLRELERRRELLDEGAGERAREREQLRAEVAEIDAARLDPDRDPDLDHELDVLANAEELRLAAEEAAEVDVAELDGRIEEARASAGQLAAELRAGRLTAGEGLSRSVESHLADLAMPEARFRVDIEPLPDGELTADGADRVTFVLAPNPGEQARPVGQAASGGERSRVSLAVEVALADVDDARVLVFDEVDAGIGGATAMAVGEKLARLAAGPAGERRQVLCVTHLAQLAAFADVHHVVDKQVEGGRTMTRARSVADEDRVAELARMLGGDPEAAAGLEHARELLETARRRRG